MILAYDAMEVSRRISGLLETAVRDVKALSLIPVSDQKAQLFYLDHYSDVTQFDSSKSALPQHVSVPLYNDISFFNSDGREVIHISDGNVKKGRPTEECQKDPMCDAPFVESALEKKKGEVSFGKLLKWYSPEGGPDNEEQATLKVAVRSAEGLHILGINYRHIKDIMYYPAFPYQVKSDLLDAYYAGNYIYMVDSDFDFLAHPKPWHVMGIDRHTGKRMEPVRIDSDEGKHPLNVKAYAGEKLRDYFDRLIKKSFTQRSIDIFRAPNLQGTLRVLSVAPILFSKGQYQKSGIFGHVITGCNVDFFEEPKERLVPYY